MEIIRNEKPREILAHGLLGLVENISWELKTHSINLPPANKSTFDILNTTPLHKIQNLNEGLGAYLQVIRGIEPDFSVRTESKLLYRALDRWGLKPADSISNNLEDYLEKEHLIEIYDQDGVQLYRNFAFFRYCSYSLLELALIDWPS